MREKRKLERFNLSIPATIELLFSGKEERTLHLQTSDICSGGAYFHTTQPLIEGTQVKVDLALSLEKLGKLQGRHKKAYIKVTGIVLRSESKGMAISFDEQYQLFSQPNTPNQTPSIARGSYKSSLSVNGMAI